MAINRIMKTVVLALVGMFLCSCSPFKSNFVQTKTKNKIGTRINRPEPEPEPIRVCVTTYWKKGAGTDHWTRAGKTSTGEALETKKTCAVDPNVIPYHSTVHIPELGLKMRAIDTGGDVKRRKASKKRGEPNTPVVDIYFYSKSAANRFASTQPYFVDAYIQ